MDTLAGVPGSRLNRLRESAWLRAGLLAVAVGLAVYGLASQWTQVHAALAKLAGYDVAGAAVSVIAGLGAMLMAWRALSSMDPDTSPPCRCKIGKFM